MNLEFTLYRMGIGFMPLDLNLGSLLKIKAGTEISKMFRTGSKDIDETITKNNALTSSTRQEDKVVKDIAFGLILEFHFGQYNLGKNLMISPMYNANLGIFEEIDTGFKTRSIRQSIGLVFNWGIKLKT